MSCKKVKNPCKICFESVNKKNGLQCQGACQKWAHYACLNYTPGKIHDIKAGIIKVTCPCPDCNTTEPKEVLVNPPFSCNNSKCPANQLPICKSQECPSKASIPLYPAPPAYSARTQDTSCSPERTIEKPVSRPCPRKHSPPTSKTCPIPRSQQSKTTSRSNTCSPKKSMSYSTITVDAGNQCIPVKATVSDSCMPKNDDQLLSAIQNICNTVGELSKHLNEIMCKIAK